MADGIRKLYRSRRERTLLGICGGLAQYAGKDPTVFRLVFVMLFVLSGFVPFGIGYLLAYFVIPLEPETENGADALK